MKKPKISFRPVNESDLEKIQSWWADGRVMEPVGFPNGLKTTKSDVVQSIERHKINAFSDYLIILNEKNNPIGEFHYTQIEKDVATFGIKIGDYDSQGKGYGKMSLIQGIKLIKTNPSILAIEINVDSVNLKALKLYDSLGFKEIKMIKDNWTDQLENLRSTLVLRLNFF